MDILTSEEEGKILNDLGSKLTNRIHETYGLNLEISKYTDVKGFFYKYCLWDRGQQSGYVMVLDKNTIEMYDALALDDTGKQGVLYVWDVNSF